MPLPIIRVFPRRTKATPTDPYAFTTPPPRRVPEAAEVHVSATFSWDLERAHQLAEAWRKTGLEVKLGGPATGSRGEAFEPGRYLADGYTITSRGCPNRCWFCQVWRREGALRELPIRPGYNVLDDNLLACSERHIRGVFDMLASLPKGDRRVQFSGGLEAARLKAWHVQELRRVRAKQVFFAYDTPDDFEPLAEAGRLLLSGGFTFSSRQLRAYVLIGHPGDTVQKAECRLIGTIRAGFVPMAMLWRDPAQKLEPAPEWRHFQKGWARPAAMGAALKRYGAGYLRPMQKRVTRYPVLEVKRYPVLHPVA